MVKTMRWLTRGGEGFVDSPPKGGELFDPTTGTWTITGGGSDITGTSDRFHFV
jgi:hypothetical protein